jgi:hypothetical protein
MLKTERNTPTMGARVNRAFRKSQMNRIVSPLGGLFRRRIAPNFEHGQWFIIDLDTGAQWSATELPGAVLLEDIEVLGQRSVGDWCAYAVCHAMIQRDDRAGLAVRSLNLMLTEDPEMESHADMLYREIYNLHSQFFDNRTGEPVLTEVAQ